MKTLRIAFSFLMVFVFLAAFAAPVSAAKGPTIVDIAAGTPGFSTLVAAAQYTGLDKVLSGKGQFTVFAPTDDAFAKLGLNADNIRSLPVKDVKNILLYHVARGERFAADVVSSSQIRMMNKGFTQISVSEAGVFINQSKIIATDIDASNGVVHVIDTVLLP
jgi:uncharacterized surface protein with fasciclin (FAS1) repeats